MPYGKKTDLATGNEIDFDKIYELAIKPAIEETGLEPLRGDEELTGGIIHTTMFARLLLSEYVVADLTLSNPNVFYELGIRHAVKPFTTVPIYAKIHPLPFDVNMVRAVVYNLKNDIFSKEASLSKEAAENLKAELKKRIQQAINGPQANDSPLFELIPKFPAIELPHEVTHSFIERVSRDREFHERLDKAKLKPSNQERCIALRDIQQELGDLRKIQASVLLDLMFSFRSVEAWKEMTDLCEAFPDYLKNNIFVRQQWAFSLNRRNKPGDRDKAVSFLTEVMKEYGPDPETLGILGSIYKAHYIETKEKESIMALAALDESISTYIGGFESDPRYYYPGINAIALLIRKGDEESLKKAEKLAPLVGFAVARCGGVSSNNYWVLATVLELYCISNEWVSAVNVLPKVLDKEKESWMLKSTLGNLMMLKEARIYQDHDIEKLQEIIKEFEKCI